MIKHPLQIGLQMSSQLFDPLKLAEEIRPYVVKNHQRRYYRVGRPGRWYGGIATADCTGCCLKCVFCWSGGPRDNPTIGEFFSAEDIFRKLDSCAKKFGYTQVRVSGNEPTLSPDHLLDLISLTDEAGYLFILETNGILVNKKLAKSLAKFENLHVRVSLKGTNEQEFSMLTGAFPEAFQLQLEALRNLLDEGVACHPAIMLSFSRKDALEDLKKRLAEIDRSLPRKIEEEYVFLYPHVVRRLKEAGIKPRVAYQPEKIPNELI
ncbi:MAG: radical SAM protein [Candidatus Hadarchaeales archaeon]